MYSSEIMMHSFFDNTWFLLSFHCGRSFHFFATLNVFFTRSFLRFNQFSPAQDSVWQILQIFNSHFFPFFVCQCPFLNCLDTTGLVHIISVHDECDHFSFLNISVSVTIQTLSVSVLFFTKKCYGGFNICLRTTWTSYKGSTGRSIQTSCLSETAWYWCSSRDVINCGICSCVEDAAYPTKYPQWCLLKYRGGFSIYGVFLAIGKLKAGQLVSWKIRNIKVSESKSKGLRLNSILGCTTEWYIEC